jgi:seryl-tRNA synthetase
MTTEYAVTLLRPVPVALADELARRLFYVDERIVAFDLLTSGPEVTGVRLTTDPPATDPPATADELARKVNLMVGDDVLTQLPPRQVIRWRSRRQDTAIRPAFDELVRRGLAFGAGEGQVAVAGPVLRLIERLDALLCGIATDELGAEEYRYPTLIPTATLRRSGYLSSFPQHVMFATWLRPDLDVYRGLSNGAEPELLALCGQPRYCLPPTMCYHTFAQLSSTALAADARVVTARGRSFRFEGQYHADLERLWDFTIREVVFLGTRQFADDCRTAFLRRATDLLDELDLVGHCEVAHDPFFGRPQAGESISSQRLLELKYEARLAVAPERSIAVGSFNLHGDRFGAAFDIRLPGGGTAHSACVGFGLERLAYAVLCQHGVDPRDWPGPLQG